MNKYKAPILLLIMVVAYLFGALSYSYNIWPIDWLRALNLHFHTPSNDDLAPNLNKLDEYERLIFTPNKTEVTCPDQKKIPLFYSLLGNQI